MPLKSIFPQVHALPIGPVNVFLIEDGHDLTVIDSGSPGNDVPILTAVGTLGRKPTDVKNIVLTHCHPDHAGGLAALQAKTKATVWMHRSDAEVVRGKTPMVRSKPSPGLLNQILYRIFIANVPGEVPQASVDREVKDGQRLPIGGGLRAIHTPGHSAGHTAFLLERDGGLLFAGDTCSNMVGLGYSIVYDDLAQGRKSLAKLAKLDPKSICFGHGGPLNDNGVQKFKQKWQKN